MLRGDCWASVDTTAHIRLNAAKMIFFMAPLPSTAGGSVCLHRGRSMSALGQKRRIWPVRRMSLIPQQRQKSRRGRMSQTCQKQTSPPRRERPLDEASFGADFLADDAVKGPCVAARWIVSAIVHTGFEINLLTDFPVMLMIESRTAETHRCKCAG